MSPPIRDGSGNNIGSARLGDGTEISEIRTGTGDVLFSAGIPDNVVDDFEDNNLTEYSGDTGNITPTSTGVVQGNFGLAVDTTGDVGYPYSLQGDGLDYYPEKGDKFSVLLFEPGGSNALPAFGFGADEDNGTVSGYSVVHFPTSNEAIIQRIDNEANSALASPSITMSAQEWYEYEVQWHDGSGSEADNTIEVTIFRTDTSADLSTELGRSSQVANFTASDSDYASNTGVFYSNATSNPQKGIAIDRYWHLGSVD